MFIIRESLEVHIPILYLSTGDFEEALAALLGKDAGGLSALDHRDVQGRLVGGAGALEPARSVRPSATSTSGPTASMCRPAWRTKPSACW